MSSFNGYYSPIEQSVKPKTWFQESRSLMRSKLMLSPVPVKGPEYEYTTEVAEKSRNVYQEELWNIIPWSITLFVIVWNLIF